MRESVIFQAIEGEALQKGAQREALSLVSRLVKRRFGAVNPEVQTQLQGLSYKTIRRIGRIAV